MIDSRLHTLRVLHAERTVTAAAYALHPVDGFPALAAAGPRGGLAARRDVRLAEAVHERWVIAPDRLDQYGLLLAACAAAGFTPRIGQHARELLALSALVAHGFGVCLVLILPEYPVHRVPLSGYPVPGRRLVAVVRRGSATHPLIGGGIEALRAVVADNDTVAGSPTG